MPLPGKHQLKVAIDLKKEWQQDFPTHQAMANHIIALLERFGKVEVTILNPDTGTVDPTMNV